MSKGFEALSPQDQDRHRRLLGNLGIDLEETLDRHISGSSKTQVMLSTDLHRTAILPRFQVVKDVATMKRYGGIPDAWFEAGTVKDDHIDYPVEWDDRYNRLIDRATDHTTLLNLISPEQRKQVRQALRASLLGHSQKVKSYETMINAIHFPQTVAIFAGNTLCVPTGTTFIIGPKEELRALNPYLDQDPSVVVFSDVCIEEGGTIAFQVPVQMQVTGTMSLQPPGGCNCS